MTADHLSPRPPIVACWGMGLDSTAMIIELVARGEWIERFNASVTQLAA